MNNERVISVDVQQAIIPIELGVIVQTEPIPIDVVAIPDIPPVVVGIEVQPDETIPVNIDVLSEIRRDVEVSVEVVGGIGDKLPYYMGAYEVTPRKVEQILSTKNKSMSDNVTVFQIPYVEVSNIGGGLTATIGIE